MVHDYPTTRYPSPVGDKMRFNLTSASSVNPSSEGIINPPVDELLDHVDAKYRLVLVAAKRARQINAYYSQLGEGLLENVGPLVETSAQEKPLSIALREIHGGLLEVNQVDPLAEAQARAEAAKDPEFKFDDPFSEIDPA